MEELRAHATDWTQNMSMDFRIPNPLEFNDPFLIQRRRWKRSERRRIRRGAQGTLGYLVRGVSENGHLPNCWLGLSSSMCQLEACSSLERAVVAKARPQVSAAGGGAVSRAAGVGRVDSAVGLQGQCRSIHQLLTHSLSLPVAASTSELDSTGAAMQEESISGSESPSGSSASLSFCALNSFQPCHSIRSMEEGGASVRVQEEDTLFPVDNTEPIKTRGQNHMPVLSLVSGSCPLTPELDPVPPESPHNLTASSPGFQLLDFFGENLAYIDESSDTLSDRTQPAMSEEKKRRSRKPKRRSMRRHLPRRWNSLHASLPNRDMQPPSNSPTPPPDSFPSDLPPSEIQTHSAPAL